MVGSDGQPHHDAQCSLDSQDVRKRATALDFMGVTGVVSIAGAHIFMANPVSEYGDFVYLY